MPKTYTQTELKEKYYNLSNPKKVEVLENALGLMESNNSQNYYDVIIKSMGFAPSLSQTYYETTWEKSNSNETLTLT